MSFTKQENVWKLEANDVKEQGKGNKSQVKQGKHYEKYLHWDLKKWRACTQTEWKYNLIFVLPNEGWKSGWGWKISVSIK